MIPRLRFAPSPTGTPHIGNLHTALFSWALARSLGGDFILRIEDSDAERNTPLSMREMMDALAWLTIDWDEGPDVGGEYGPYIQSERLARHQAVAAQLHAQGDAYYGDDPAETAVLPNAPLRLRLPKEGQTVLNDAIRGPIQFDNHLLSDPVIVRSDGRPLYHLAAMVDDHDMEISHVVRGEEWIATSPIHIQLYKAMGWTEPIWVHLPLILNLQGQKLKKRDPEGGYLIRDFQNAGYLPKALFNYLLLLGWSPDGEQELVDKWHVRKQFRLERLSTSPSIFDWDKLNWVNQQYIHRLSDKQLAEAIRPFLEDAYDTLPNATGWLERLTAVVRSTIVKLEDAISAAQWALDTVLDYTDEATDLLQTETAHHVISQCVAELIAIVLLDEQTAHTILNGLRSRLHEQHGWNAATILKPIRAALTGDVNGPPVHQIMGLIGKQTALQRLADALQ